MKNNPLTVILKNTFRFKFPHCGQGDLYDSFLKLATLCRSCKADLSNIRADDAPAWLTIFIVGHIITPILLFVLPNLNYPDWILILLIIIPSLVLALIILPFSKSLFVGIIWYQKNKL